MSKKRWQEVRRIEDAEEPQQFQPFQPQQPQESPQPKSFPVVSAKTPGQKRYIQAIQNNDIVLCSGPAGTGKTAIATGMGLQMLLDPQSGIKKLVIIRPAVEACGERLGALPGTLAEKASPWAAPVIDNMEVFSTRNQIKRLFNEKKIEIIPVAYARGRSLAHSFVCIDEAQTTTPAMLLLLLTRIGEGSRMVVSGDLTQTEHSSLNGLSDAINRLSGMGRVGIVALNEDDIVRHDLIREIVRRYAKRSPSPGGLAL